MSAGPLRKGHRRKQKRRAGPEVRVGTSSLGTVRGAAWEPPAPPPSRPLYVQGRNIFLCDKDTHGRSHGRSPPSLGEPLSAAPVCPRERRLAEAGPLAGTGAGGGREGGLRSSLALAISDPPKVCSSRVSAPMRVTGSSQRSLYLTPFAGPSVQSSDVGFSAERAPPYPGSLPGTGAVLHGCPYPTPPNPATCSRPD